MWEPAPHQISKQPTSRTSSPATPVEEVEGEVNYVPLWPNDKQAEFLLATVDHRYEIIMYYGGAGAGKTQGAVQAIISRAHENPGDRIAIIRKYKIDHQNTTWPEFVSAIPPELVLRKLEQERVLYILSCNPAKPSKIEFNGMDERNRWGGRAYSFIVCDEANELSDRDLWYLYTRMRHVPALEGRINPYVRPDGDVHRCIVLIANPPDTPDHWLRVLKNERRLRGKAFSVKVVHTRTYDNTALPKGYLQMMENLPESERLRMMEGEDVDWFEGKPCCPEFDPGHHVISGPLPHEPFTGFEGWDLGVNHPYVGLFEDRNGIYTLWAEVDLKDLDTWELAEQVILARALFPLECLWTKSYLDHIHSNQRRSSSKETDAKILKGLGFSVKSAYSKPNDRAILVNRLLHQGRFFVHKSCTSAIRALRGGWRRDETGEVEKDGYYDDVGDGIGIALWNRTGVKAERGLPKPQVEVPETNKIIRIEQLEARRSRRLYAENRKYYGMAGGKRWAQ